MTLVPNTSTGPAGVSDEQLWKEGEELLRKIEVARQDKKHAEQELKNIMQRKEAAKSVSLSNPQAALE